MLPIFCILKKYYNLFNKDISNIVNSELIEKEIEKTFNEKMLKIKANDPFRNGKITSLNNQRKEDLEALECIKKKKNVCARKNLLKNIETRLDEVNKNTKIKNITDFDEHNCNSIKSLAIKKNANVKITTHFMKGKMLMFSKFHFQVLFTM